MSGLFSDDVSTPRDDLFDDALLDQPFDGTADGSLHAGYQPLASVIAAARAPATDAELAGELDALALFRSRRHGTSGSRRRSRRAKAFVVVSVVGVSLATGAAAATGNLPDAAQDLASALLEKVGIHIPSSTPDSDEPTAHGSSSSRPARPPSATGGPPAGAPAGSETDRARIDTIVTSRREGSWARSPAASDPPKDDTAAGRPAPADAPPAAPTDQPPPADPPREDPVSPPESAGGLPESAPGGPPPEVGGGPPVSPPGGPPPEVGGGAQPGGALGPQPAGGDPPPGLDG